MSKKDKEDKNVKNIDYSYPEQDDKEIVSKIYKKREFQYFFQIYCKLIRLVFRSVDARIPEIDNKYY